MPMRAAPIGGPRVRRHAHIHYHSFAYTHSFIIRSLHVSVFLRSTSPRSSSDVEAPRRDDRHRSSRNVATAAMFTASSSTMTTLSSRFTATLRIAPHHRVADAKPRTAVIECAHKKGTGSVKNGRDGNAKYLGVKKYGEEKVTTGCIIVRQRGNKVRAMRSSSSRARRRGC